MAEPTFTGPFRKEMENFISLKRSVGYKYNTEPGILKRFDSYLAAKYPDVAALSREAVTGWCARTMHESAANHSHSTVCVSTSLMRWYASFQNTWTASGSARGYSQRIIIPPASSMCRIFIPLKNSGVSLRKQISAACARKSLTGIW